MDLAIAATANAHGVPLLTHNRRDLQIIRDLTDARHPADLQPTETDDSEESPGDVV
jgi:toxin FitB